MKKCTIMIHNPKQLLPKKSLLEYQRVTPAFFAKFQEKYKVDEYLIKGTDYTLVVSSRDKEGTKYKATRTRLFKLVEGTWIVLGGYFYI